MKTIEEHLAGLDKAKRDIAIFQEHRDKLIKDLVAEHSPHKIGDVIDVRGYYHKGKKCRVNWIGAKEDSDGKTKFRVRATVLKKDGTDSQHTASWSAPILSPTETKP